MVQKSEPPASLIDGDTQTTSITVDVDEIQINTGNLPDEATETNLRPKQELSLQRLAMESMEELRTWDDQRTRIPTIEMIKEI